MMILNVRERERERDHLYRFQQQAGAQETGKTGDEPQHGDVLSEAMARPHGHAAGQGDPRPATPQGSTTAQRGEPAGTAHICHDWRRGRKGQGRPQAGTALMKEGKRGSLRRRGEGHGVSA